MESKAKSNTLKANKAMTSRNKQMRSSKKETDTETMALSPVESVACKEEKMERNIMNQTNILTPKTEKIQDNKAHEWMVSLPVQITSEDRTYVKFKEEDPPITLPLPIKIDKMSPECPDKADKKEQTDVIESASFTVRRSRRQSVCIEKLNNRPDPETNLDVAKSSAAKEAKDFNEQETMPLKHRAKGSLDKPKIPRRHSIAVQPASYKKTKAEQLPVTEPPSELLSGISKKRPRETAGGPLNKAKRRKLSLTDSASENKVIEEVIEDIWHVSVVSVDDEPVMRFLVKWDGFDPSENTYEPFEHVSHVNVLQEYVQRKFEIHQDRTEAAMKKLLASSRKLEQRYNDKSKAFILGKLSKFDPLRFKCGILAYIYTYQKIPLMSSFMCNLRYQNVLNKFHEKLMKEDEANKALVANIIQNENKNIKVFVNNPVDFEPVPDFKYLRRVKYPKKPKTKMGCDCKNGCSQNSGCCPRQLGLDFVYDVDGRLYPKSHQMIVECNEFCKCVECPNRRKEVTLSACIFKTADRGWGLKTLNNIPPGVFVIEYTGKLIDQKEMDKRSKVYDKAGNNYLFALDYNETREAHYSIDATYEGNLSRFINHSCEANLQTWPATSCNESMEMHRLYYFSLRHIKAGEELTIDYNGGVIDPVPSKGAVKCKCGSSLCKGFLF